MTLATQLGTCIPALFPQSHMTSHALVVKRFFEMGLGFPVMAGGTLDVLSVILQLALVQHIFPIFIPMMTVKAFQALHVKRVLKCNGGTLFALKRIGIVEQNFFGLPKRY
jgi:hypothetical protein